MKSERDTYWQHIRGMAIISVVMIHSFGAATGMRNTDLHHNFEFVVILRQFINFAVPIFLFISGYFAIKDNKYNRNMQIKSILRVLIPFIVWTILDLILLKRMYQFNITSIIYNVIMLQVNSTYYYIVALIQMIIITPILFKYINKKGLLISVIAINIIHIFVIYIGYMVGRPIPFPSYAVGLTAWIVFYTYGLLIKSNISLTKKIEGNFKLNLCLYIIFLIASIVEAKILVDRFDLVSLAFTQLKITSMITNILFINVIIGLKSKVKVNKNIVSIIGDKSFGIYLIHIPFLNVVSSVLNKYETIYNTQIIYITLLSSITIAICILFIEIVKRILGSDLSKRLLGF